MTSLLAETSFALDLLATFPANHSLVFSPFSLALALSLVQTGASEETRRELEDVVFRGANYSRLVHRIKTNTSNEIELNLANRLYLGSAQKDFVSTRLGRDYLENVRNNFEGDAVSIHFSAEDSASKVNEFVKNATGGRIAEVLDSEALSNVPEMDAILVNAITFRGEWLEPFEKKSTASGDFLRVDGTVVQTEYLHDAGQKRDFASDDVFDVLVVHYRDAAYKMAVFLPKMRNTLMYSKSKLDSKRFQRLLDTAEYKNVKTTIPKFKAADEFDIRKKFEEMGVREAFVGELSELAPGSKVVGGVHRLFLEIDEGTGLETTESKKEEIPIEFIADHPFLFAILRENHILFLGEFHGI